MNKSEPDASRQRRPAARRDVSSEGSRDRASDLPPSAASSERDAESVAADDSAQSQKRIRARRVQVADASLPARKAPRSAAVRGARPGRPASEIPPASASVPPPRPSSPPPTAAVVTHAPFVEDVEPAAPPPPPSPTPVQEVEHAPRPYPTLHSDAAALESLELVTPPAPASRRASTSLRVRADIVDEFGLDVAYEAKLRPFFEAMFRNYLHVQVIGAHNIPAHGRALLVSNHSRSLAWDGILLRTALRANHEAQREARWLVEDDQFHAPFLGTFINRLGAVRACQENAERLLQREELVAVFPEGVKGGDKRYQDRHKLHRFGRGGYVKLALRTGAPVIPVAIIGRDDPSPMLSKVKALSRWVGVPLFALTSGLPKLGPLGVPPVPGRWRIAIGEPMQEIARQDSDATRDEGLVHELNECVRSAVKLLVEQAMPDVS